MPTSPQPDRHARAAALDRLTRVDLIDDPRVLCDHLATNLGALIQDVRGNETRPAADAIVQRLTFLQATVQELAALLAPVVLPPSGE